MNDYSSAFTDDEIESSPVNIMGGRFSRDNFNKNIEKYSIETWRRERAQKVNVWAMTYKEEDYDEDNDTEEDEEEEEEESEEPEEMYKGIEEKKKSGKIAEIINPSKGFKFFIEQEQKLLERIAKKQKQSAEKLKENNIEVVQKQFEDSVDIAKKNETIIRIICISDTHMNHW